jgi:hypothetical protein
MRLMFHATANVPIDFLAVYSNSVKQIVRPVFDLACMRDKRGSLAVWTGSEDCGGAE